MVEKSRYAVLRRMSCSASVLVGSWLPELIDPVADNPFEHLAEAVEQCYWSLASCRLRNRADYSLFQTTWDLASSEYGVELRCDEFQDGVVFHQLVPYEGSDSVRSCCG